jgi:hypothetical protein
MTRRSLSLLSATAALALFGGLHLEIASGRTLDRLAPNDARLQTATRVAEADVNRNAKADRAKIASNAAERPRRKTRNPTPRSASRRSPAKARSAC